MSSLTSNSTSGLYPYYNYPPTASDSTATYYQYYVDYSWNPTPTNHTVVYCKEPEVQIGPSTTLFADYLSDRKWRMSYFELANLPWVESPNKLTEDELKAHKRYVIESVKRHKGAKKNLLSWARIDRTEEASKGIGWAASSDEIRDRVVEMLESA